VSTPRPAETPVTRIRLPRKFTLDNTSSVVDVAPNTSAISFLLFPSTEPHRFSYKNSYVAFPTDPFHFAPTSRHLTTLHVPRKPEIVSESLDNRSLSPVTSK